MKPLISKNPFFRFFTAAFYYMIAIPILGFFDTVVFGLRVRGRKNIQMLKGKGAVVVCNHVHNLDCTFLALLDTPRKSVFTSMEILFSQPVVGPLIHCLGSVPVPAVPSKMRRFICELTDAVKSGRLVCIYPEGELIPYCTQLRSFKEGAFTIAAKAGAPVIPVMITERENKGLWKILKRKPCLTITAGEPLYPDSNMEPRFAARDLCSRAFSRMSEIQGTGEKTDATKRSA